MDTYFYFIPINVNKYGYFQIQKKQNEFKQNKNLI